MRLHHLKCISSCPLGGALMDRRSVGLRGKLACHCVLIEAGNELVLFDTGFGLLDCANLPPEILMVPLVGHTMGHAGLVVSQDNGNWLLLAGDAYFDKDEMHPSRPRCAPGLRAYQWMMQKDHEQRVENQRRLRELARDHAEEVHLICSHDPRELERDSGHHLDQPIRAPLSGHVSALYESR